MNRASSESKITVATSLDQAAVVKSRRLLGEFLSKKPEAPLDGQSLALRLQGISRAVSNLIEDVFLSQPDHSLEPHQEDHPLTLRAQIETTDPGTPLHLEATQETATNGASLAVVGNKYADQKNYLGVLMKTQLPLQADIERWLIDDNALLLEHGDTVSSKAINEANDTVTSYPFHMTRSSEEHRLRYLRTTQNLIKLATRIQP